MNIKKKTKIILLICCALLILSVGVFAAIHFIQVSPKIPTEEKLVNTIYPLWGWYDIESASETATTIVYGTLGPKGKLKKNMSTYSNGEPHVLERYRKAKIQVIQMIKGDMDAKKVSYWELSSEETEDRIYVYHGAKSLEEGKNYLLFLNENGAYLSPSTAILVDENGILIPSESMRIESEAQAQSEESLPVPLEDYIAEIQKHLD